MLAAAQLAIHVCHMSGFDEMQQMFDTITVNSAKTFGIADSYGIAPGRRADFVILDARSVLDALRLCPARLTVVKAGRRVAETKPSQSRIQYGKKQKPIDFRHDR
jgi:cytosine deaminase